MEGSDAVNKSIPNIFRGTFIISTYEPNMDFHFFNISGSFKLNTPKQVRRRHSDSENEDLNKALQERQELEQQEKQRQQQKQVSNGKTAGEAPVAAAPSSAKPESTPSSSKTNSKSDHNKDGESKPNEPSVTDKLTIEICGNAGTPAPSVAGKVDSVEVQSKPTKDSSSLEGSSSKVEAVVRRTKSNLKKEGSRKSMNRVSFDPLALLLDASLEGELDLVKKVAVQVRTRAVLFFQ